MTITSRWLPSVPDVTVSWHQPWSEPPRRKSALAAIALMASGLFSPVIQPSPAVAFGWGDFGLIPSTLSVQYQARVLPPFQPAPTTPTISYSQLSEPVRQKTGLARSLQPYFQLNPLPITPSFGWFNDLERPPRATPRVTRAEQSSWSLPQDQANLGWLGRLSEPSRQAPRTRPSDQSTIFQPTINLGWLGSLSEPVRRRATTQADQAYSPFVQAEVVTVDKWFSPFGIPTKRRASTPSEQAYLPFVTTEVVTVDKWFKAFAEPPGARRGLTAASQQALAFYPFPFPPAAVSLDWLSQFSDPTKTKPSLISTRDAENQWEAVGVSIEWFGGLSEPVLFKIGLRAAYQQALALYPFPVPDAPILFGWGDFGLIPSALTVQYQVHALPPFPQPVVVNNGWFTPLSEPVRKARVASFDPQSQVYFQQPVAPSYDWFRPFTDPARRKPLAASDRQIQPAFPVIPSYGWFKGWDDFARKKPSVLGPQFVGFSPSPIIPSYGWYARLTEPVRKKPKVWEGIFEARPPAALVTTYAASMDATEQGDLFQGLLSGFSAPVVALVDIIENDPRHRGNMGIIETDPESGILTAIVEPETVPSTGTPVSTVAGARVAIIIS